VGYVDKLLSLRALLIPTRFFGGSFPALPGSASRLGLVLLDSCDLGLDPLDALTAVQMLVKLELQPLPRDPPVLLERSSFLALDSELRWLVYQHHAIGRFVHLLAARTFPDARQSRRV
jgi:hypothetical protein